jgi:hypothetical protein
LPEPLLLRDTPWTHGQVNPRGQHSSGWLYPDDSAADSTAPLGVAGDT